MTFRSVINYFWHWLIEPVSPYPLALFRILFGLLLITNGIFLYEDLDMWFSTGGIFPISVSRSMIGTQRLNVFLLLGDSHDTVMAVYWTYMVSSLFLTIGMFPGKMSLLIFMALASFTHRNLYILNSGDTFMRLVSFILIFAPSGAALSVESMIRGYPLKRINPAAFRVLQFQVCLLYAAAFAFKATGADWLNGSAVYIVQQLTEFQRFPQPDFLKTAFASKVMTWGTLVAEGAFPLLVWFNDTRLPVIAGLVVLHLGIEYTMNIQLFEWLLISSLCLFLNESEIKRFISPLAERVTFFRSSQDDY